MKKNGNVKIVVILLIIAIAVIVGMGIYIYNINTRKATLEENVKSLDSEISSLQDTIKVQENEMKDSKEVSNKTNEAEKQPVKIEGIYEIDGNENSELIFYTFSGNKVTYEALHTQEGTFEIVDDKIKITYDVAYGPEGEKLDDFPIGKEEELTIIDENTLVSVVKNDSGTFSSLYKKKI